MLSNNFMGRTAFLAEPGRLSRLLLRGASKTDYRVRLDMERVEDDHGNNYYLVNVFIKRKTEASRRATSTAADDSEAGLGLGSVVALVRPEPSGRARAADQSLELVRAACRTGRKRVIVDTAWSQMLAAGAGDIRRWASSAPMGSMGRESGGSVKVPRGGLKCRSAARKHAAHEATG